MPSSNVKLLSESFDALFVATIHYVLAIAVSLILDPPTRASFSEVSYLIIIRRTAFASSDVDFLLQVIKHTMPAIHHIRTMARCNEHFILQIATSEQRLRYSPPIHSRSAPPP